MFKKIVLFAAAIAALGLAGCASVPMADQSNPGNSAQVEKRNCNLAMAAGFLTPGPGGFAMEMNQATKNYNQCRGD